MISSDKPVVNAITWYLSHQTISILGKPLQFANWKGLDKNMKMITMTTIHYIFPSFLVRPDSEKKNIKVIDELFVTIPILDSSTPQIRMLGA
jgi:hypothetical protein